VLLVLAQVLRLLRQRPHQQQPRRVRLSQLQQAPRRRMTRLTLSYLRR
jgi:hypothetical protein